MLQVLHLSQPTRRLLLIAAATNTFLAPLQAIAGLTWDVQRVRMTARVSDKHATADFSFRNTGLETVTITNLKASCECTVPQLEKRSYAPGESGKITAVFTFGARVGMQEKTIDVVTNETGAKPTQLSLGVNILELVTCSPRLFHWNVNEDKQERIATLAVLGANPIVEIKISEISPADYVARIETIETGKSYCLAALPKTTSTESQSRITCSVRFADGTSQSVILAGLVK